MKSGLRRFMAIFTLVAVIVTLYPDYELKAETMCDINSPEVFIKQPVGSVTCTLCGNAMMLRRLAIINGDTNWRSITADAMYSTAWLKGAGVYWNYTYKGMSVGKGVLPAGESAKKAYLIEFLKTHPEGIVLYDKDRLNSPANNRGGGPHAVLLTDYTDGVFYYADPNPRVAGGRLPMTASSSVTIAMADNFWYVKSKGEIAPAPKPVAPKPVAAPKPPEIKPTDISLEYLSITLNEIGAAERLNVTIAPTNATNKKVNWKSSDTSVVTVSSDGTVKAVGQGSAVITATTESGAKSTTCIVDVILTEVDDATLDPEKVEQYVKKLKFPSSEYIAKAKKVIDIIVLISDRLHN